MAAASPRTFQQAILWFSDYQNCHDALVAVRWPDGVVRCPTCGSDKLAYLKNAHVWKCYGQHARPKFSLKVGTAFEDSPLPLQTWLPALWLLTNCKNGMSSYELARALGITQKSAWFMRRRLGAAANVLRRATHNARAVPDVPADVPDGTMDRFTDGLRRVIAAPKVLKQGTLITSPRCERPLRSPSRDASAASSTPSATSSRRRARWKRPAKSSGT